MKYLIIYYNILDYSEIDGPYDTKEIATQNVNFATRKEADEAIIVRVPVVAHFFNEVHKCEHGRAFSKYCGKCAAKMMIDPVFHSPRKG